MYNQIRSKVSPYLKNKGRQFDSASGHNLKLKLIRLKKNIKNYIRSKQAAKNEPGLIRRGDESES